MIIYKGIPKGNFLRKSSPWTPSKPLCTGSFSHPYKKGWKMIFCEKVWGGFGRDLSSKGPPEYLLIDYHLYLFLKSGGEGDDGK